ncbi:hypothetical protein ACI2KD_01220 [Pseudomonas monteilii]
MGKRDLHPWSKDALCNKALLYIDKMEGCTSDEWEYGFWSALALELLARAALANISPMLLADAKNWRNLTYAQGHETTAKRFSPSSVGMVEVLSRLNELVPTFTEEVAGFCGKHTERRNAELHTGELIFSSLGTSEWLPRFYLAAKILLESMNKKFSDYIGDPATALNMIDSLGDEAARAVNQDIKAYAHIWSQKNKADRESAAAQATTWATRQTGHRVECPSCKLPALVTGSPVGTVAQQVEEDVVIERQTMLPAAFECIACGLRIGGLSKLSACGLGDAFTARSTYSVAEYFGLFTEDDVDEARREGQEYEPDFNE